MAKKPPKKHLTISRIDADTFKINRRLKWEPPADYLPGEPLAKRVCEYLHDQITDWRKCEPENPLVHDISKRTQHGTEWTTRDELSKAGHLLAHARHAQDMESKGKPIEWFLIDVGYRVAELNYVEAWSKQTLRDKQQIERQEKAEYSKSAKARWRRSQILKFLSAFDLWEEQAPYILAKINRPDTGFEDLKKNIEGLKKRRKLEIIRDAKKNK